jgi:hypothetical protein
MAFYMKSPPFNNGKKKSSFGGTPDSTEEQKRREEATDQLFNEGKITETNNKAYRKINKRVRKNKRKEIRSIKKS